MNTHIAELSYIIPSGHVLERNLQNKDEKHLILALHNLFQDVFVNTAIFML